MVAVVSGAAIDVVVCLFVHRNGSASEVAGAFEVVHPNLAVRKQERADIRADDVSLVVRVAHPLARVLMLGVAGVIS